jgi:putative SOS response-associated peptidase YedK
VTDKDLAECFGAVSEVEWAPRYNIAPTDMVPIVRQDMKLPTRRLTLAKWGLVPSWAKEASIGPKLINARAESLTEKPAFRESFLTRRCLVPANGFYEWRKLTKGTQPFHIGMPDESIFGLAGLWERWRSPNGEWLKSCTIITVPATPQIKDIHDRMPLIIPEGSYELWLDPAFKDPAGLQELLRPAASEHLSVRTVSSRVSNVKYDDAACAIPAEPEQQLKLRI